MGRVGTPNPLISEGHPYLVISKGLDWTLKWSTLPGLISQRGHHRASPGPQNPAGHLGPGGGGQVWSLRVCRGGGHRCREEAVRHLGGSFILPSILAETVLLSLLCPKTSADPHPTRQPGPATLCAKRAHGPGTTDLYLLGYCPAAHKLCCPVAWNCSTALPGNCFQKAPCWSLLGWG